MTVFKYINSKDGSLIGYHISSFCQIGPLEKAKQYRCTELPNIQRQLEIIRSNLDNILDMPDEPTDRFLDTLRLLSKAQFNNLTKEDIGIQAEFI